MKHLLFAIMLLAVTQSNAQKTKKDTIPFSKNGYAPLTISGLTQNSPTTYYIREVAKWQDGSDTLEVFYGKIKFIKIGTDVFEITSPSLKKVEQTYYFNGKGFTIATPYYSPTQL